MSSDSAPKDSIARCAYGQGAATMFQEARNGRGCAPWRGRTRRPGRQPSRRPRRRLAARRAPLKEVTMAPRRVWARRRAPAAGAEGARTHRSPGGEGRPAPGARRAPGPRAPRTAQTSLSLLRLCTTRHISSEVILEGSRRKIIFFPPRQILDGHEREEQEGDGGRVVAGFLARVWEGTSGSPTNERIRGIKARNKIIKIEPVSSEVKK